MESFQDIIVQSKKSHDYRQTSERDIEKLRESDLDYAMQKFFKEKHQMTVDSMHFKSEYSYEPLCIFLKLKAESLLMDESSMRFYQQVLNIYPEPALQTKAIKYVATLINKLDTLKATHDTFTHKRITKELKRLWDD